MEKKIRRLTGSSFILIIIAVLVFGGTVSFAWLASSWGNADFSITDAFDPAVVDVEMWRNVDEEWTTTAADDGTGGKKVPSVGTFSGNTFTPITDGGVVVGLYFGAVHNLVQAQDNPPVYLKLAVELEPHTTNTILVNLTYPSNYVSIYREESGASPKLTVNPDNALNPSATFPPNFDLSDPEQFKFILASFNSGSQEYSIADGELPDGFETYYNGSGLKSLDEDSTDEKQVTLTNTTDTTTTEYIYVSFRINPDALQDLLNETTVKFQMPVYLFFNVNFDIDVHTSHLD